MDSQCTVQPDQFPINVRSEQPWLDERGFKLSADKLKIISQQWDQRTWEQYLTWYESPLAETIVEPYIYEKQLDKLTEHIFIRAQSSASDELRSRIAKALATLSPRQLDVVNLTFWEGRSIRQTAEKLGIKKSTVADLKRRALRNIALALKGVPDTSHTMGGIKTFLLETGTVNGKEVLELAERKIPKAG